MTEARQTVQIAVNTMRARLTVVGFNLVIITFQLSTIPQLPGAVELPNTSIPLHIASDISLLIGLALSVIAIVSFIISSQFNRAGTCDHWSLLAGDLFMYQALAYSVAGFFAPTLHLLGQATINLPPEAGELIIVRMAAVVAGGFAWFLAAYVGPAVSLLRSPFGKRITMTLGCFYLLLLLLTAHFSAQVVLLEAVLRDTPVDTVPTLFSELFQPLRW